MQRLKEIYENKIIPSFIKSGYKNKLAVPKVTKVVVNVGIGKVRDNEKIVAQIKSNMVAITGQAPAIRKSKKAIAGFKVRENENVGMVVTLRGDKMYDFLDKLANVTLPRIRDFRGLDPKSFDKGGNFTLGIRENVFFPEVAHITDNIHGLEVTIVTTAIDQKAGESLLKELGFPFRGEK